MSKAQKTSFETINNALAETFAQYFTVQNNEVNQYARICYTDNFKKDNYKVFKDFAIYYDRVNSYKISIADSTLIDCSAFKENYVKTDKTRALEFAVKSEDLVNAVYEITAQRLMQTDKVVTFDSITEKKTTKARQRKNKETA